MIEIYNNLQEQIAKLIVSSNIHFYQGNLDAIPAAGYSSNYI